MPKLVRRWMGWSSDRVERVIDAVHGDEVRRDLELSLVCILIGIITK